MIGNEMTDGGRLKNIMCEFVGWWVLVSSNKVVGLLEEAIVGIFAGIKILRRHQEERIGHNLCRKSPRLFFFFMEWSRHKVRRNGLKKTMEKWEDEKSRPQIFIEMMILLYSSCCVNGHRLSLES